MGGQDHTVPEAITKSALKQYRGSSAAADGCLAWLAKQGL